jgi:GDP-D-mannose 3',5'-epimerase
MFIDDCLQGTRALMESDITEPINIGSSEMVTINQLVNLAEQIAGIKVKRNYNLNAPKGVRGRSSDNTLIRSKLGWEPSIPLQTGLERTYAWIYDQMKSGVSRDRIVDRF